jgi:Ca2+-binding EF-hand superfamily protein
MRERMVDQFQAHDDDGDGLVTVEEFGERYGSMVRRLDRNDDGEITQDDLRRRPRDRDRGGNDG